MAILWNISNLKHCSCNRESGSTTAQTTDGGTAIITADKGYGFYGESTDYTFTYGRPSTMKSRNATISDDKTQLTIKTPDPKNTTQIVINGITATLPTENPDTPETPTYYYVVNGTFTHCKCNKSNNDTVKSGDTIIISADTNYYFDNDIYDSLSIRGTNYVYTISDDKKRLTFNITDSFADTNITIGSVTATLQPTTTTSDFLNIYLPTNDELNLLAKQRFIDIAQDSKFDYGTYILQLYRCYIPISDTYKQTDTIHLANSDTGISTTKLLNNVVEIETTIKIDGLLYDTDYRALLYIPNNDSYISVDINHVFNKTLTIKLSYELYSNKCQYKLLDNGVVFDYGTFVFGSNIPFRFYNDIAENSYNYNPPISNSCYILLIGDTITSVSNINFEYFNGDLLEIDNTNISDDNYNEIVTLLNSGIYL